MVEQDEQDEQHQEGVVIGHSRSVEMEITSACLIVDDPWSVVNLNHVSNRIARL